MIEERIRGLVAKRRCTLLGVGPMSKNCVDATIELANETDTYLMLIASRRQIDSEHFGGGYVNGWTTEQFAKYVTINDKKGKIILCRDHGGPWQSDHEKKANMSLKLAMESAKISYKADILAGFEVIHIDPSIDIHGKASLNDILDRVFELYEYCHSVGRQHQRKLAYEIGTEEQTGSTDSIDTLDYAISKITEFCTRNRIPKPSFVVAQTGTRVMETRNYGSLESPFRIADELPPEIQIPRIVDLCRRHNIFLKQHNTDYLSTDTLKWHPKLGIHSANVAPEFGVAETHAIVELLKRKPCSDLLEHFYELAYSSEKWQKWLIPDSRATKEDKALMAGHYVFADQRFIELKGVMQQRLGSTVNVDEFLKHRVKASIFRYVDAFNLIEKSTTKDTHTAPS